ncbi:2,3-diaminopropionate biosynthesis protein SbnB [Pseudoalteromonas sp. OOF1S-7]|uniref:2,3-diaminopropionate biosynthesis protein SbnB n=1 Tax=Pseudoalteromonas sp. OOF1S-7 TaxID=2917757 RepID=UPI001EF6089B|nr:2,3-diaminopropionate biosynthesis protein SbnB [Pseudoalteromonas sp. OOF1S-7]MCG7533912.1 2,3-diaminopropionate biosynthesis protein SbnB [Pseudoalteromonas sp. OOF1S-7]
MLATSDSNLSFSVISAPLIQRWLDDNASSLLDIIASAYQLHADDRVVNPDSYFLRFPTQPQNRIIALPASIEGEEGVAGIKWISSFPDNIEQGKNRASAVIIVNDRQTGYPRACLEGSLISAARTAASAVLGASYLHLTPGKCRHLVIVGSGPIAFNTLTIMLQLNWDIAKITVVDKNLSRAEAFAQQCEHNNMDATEQNQVIADADMVLFATSAIEPYISDAELFANNPTVLHLSLRDIAPDIILDSQNIADDVDHVLKANTSVHKAQLQVGHKTFMAGGIVDLISGSVQPDPDKPRIFSPFGMGCLDLAVAERILRDCDGAESLQCHDFFPPAHGNKA